MARTRDQVLASARAFMADCKPLQYDCEPGVFVNGRRRHLDQDDDPEDGRDCPSAEGSQQYATARSKAGLPVRMNVSKSVLSNPSGFSAPLLDVSGAVDTASQMIHAKPMDIDPSVVHPSMLDHLGPRTELVRRSPLAQPVPRTLEEQKSLARIVANGELRDIYPKAKADRGIDGFGGGFGESKARGLGGDFSLFDPPAMAVAADRLEERGHTLAAKIARWRAATEDPKNFGHLWTKQHAEEHAAGYSANPGGVQQYGLRDSLKKAARTAAAGAAIAGGGAAGMNAGNLVLPTATWMGHPIAVAAGKGPQFIDRSIDTLEKMQQMHESSPAIVQKTAKVITKPVSSMEDTVDMFRLGTGMPVSQLHTPHNFGPIIAGGAAGAGLAAGLLARRRSRKGPGTYAASGDAIAGGVADNRDADEFDREDVAEGSREEMEHTRDPGIAQEIARDHLAEDPEYYRKLRKAGLTEYATERAKAGLPVRMNLMHINNLPGQSHIPSIDLSLSASAAGYAGNKGSGFSGSRPVPRTLQEQKDLVKLVAKGGLKDVYPAGDNPVSDVGFGEMKRGGMHTFDPPAMAVAADRLQDRGHMLAAKIARWRAATEDPKNFGHLWTKQHAEEHAAGYSAKPGGVQSYATARAKAGLPVEMNLSVLGARMVKGVPWGRMQGDDYPERSASVISPIPRKDLRESAEKWYSTPVDPKNPPLIGVPFPRTLAEQKSLVKAMAKGEFADVYPWTSGTHGFGEIEVVGKGSNSSRGIAANPAELAVASDRLEERGHTLAAKIARWRAATEDPENFGHLWTKEHAAEHAAGYAASMSENQRDGMSVQYAADLVCGM